MAVKILIINGPNLNLLGMREPEVYGKETLSDIERICQKRADSHEVGIDFKQSNHEGEIVDLIQSASKDYVGIIINPAAYTHTSVAIRDALLSTDLPIIELHLSNVHKREEFRQHSYVSDIAHGVICGFGSKGYALAVEAMVDLVKNDGASSS